MTLNEAREYTFSQAGRFRLGQWNVHVRWGSKKELTDEKTKRGLCGFIQWPPTPEYKDAFMVLNRNFDDASIKSTIRHELIHLLLEGHKPMTGKYDREYEFGLNTLCELL